MAYVDPGELKYNIQIILPEITVDENDHYVKRDGQVLNLKAAVRAVKSEDIVESGAERMRETLQFIIRWRSGVDSSAAVVFRGRHYELTYVDPTPFAEKFMRLKGMSVDEGVGADGQYKL